VLFLPAAADAEARGLSWDTLVPFADAGAWMT
jgi:hypothetical protein